MKIGVALPATKNGVIYTKLNKIGFHRLLNRACPPSPPEKMKSYYSCTRYNSYIKKRKFDHEEIEQEQTLKSCIVRRNSKSSSSIQSYSSYQRQKHTKQKSRTHHSYRSRRWSYSGYDSSAGGGSASFIFSSFRLFFFFYEFGGSNLLSRLIICTPLIIDGNMLIFFFFYENFLS